MDATETGKTGRGVGKTHWVADTENKESELRSCVNSTDEIYTHHYQIYLWMPQKLARLAGELAKLAGLLTLKIKKSESKSCVNSMKYILTTIRYTCGCHRNW